MFEDRAIRMGFIVLADRVQDRQRRSMELARDAPRDLAGAAMALLGEALRATKDFLALVVADLREIGRLGDLFAMRREEAIDTAQEKPDAPLAIREDEASAPAALSAASAGSSCW